MNIAFICNQNQARSQLLSAYFSELVPEHNFESFGLIAQENTPIPMVIDSVFKDWGLNPKGLVARNMNIHWALIESFDFIIAMTSFIATEVKNLGFKGKIVNLETEAEFFSLALKDPQLMSREQCAFELSKYLKVSFSVLQRYGFIKMTKAVKALIPESESSIVETMKIALNQKGNHSVVVYGDLLAPTRNLFDQPTEAHSEYHYNRLSSKFEFSYKSQNLRVLVPDHAVMHPAKIYLGKAWSQLLEIMIREEIILITPPLQSNSRFIPESFLAAVQASEIQIIRRGQQISHN